MSESVDARPSNQVLPHELPASLGDPILVTWIREPLDAQSHSVPARK